MEKGGLIAKERTDKRYLANDLKVPYLLFQFNEMIMVGFSDCFIPGGIEKFQK